MNDLRCVVAALTPEFDVVETSKTQKQRPRRPSATPAHNQQHINNISPTTDRRSSAISFQKIPRKSPWPIPISPSSYTDIGQTNIISRGSGCPNGETSHPDRHRTEPNRSASSTWSLRLFIGENLEIYCSFVTSPKCALWHYGKPALFSHFGPLTGK